MTKNNIKKLLTEQHMSINQLQQRIGMSYPATHNLVSRETLDTIPLGTLLKVSESLGVGLQDLYSETKYL